MTINQMRSFKNIILKIFIHSCICQFLFCTIVGTLGSQNLEEYKIKAAFVYNFTKLIQWSETAFGSGKKIFKIAVFGDDHLKASFMSIDGKISAGRVISIQFLDHEADDYQEAYKKALTESQIAFISKDIRWKQVLKILNDIEERPILSIGENKNFSRAGGIIQFFTRDDRLHFEVNIQSARTHRLKFSSRLLKLAVIVNE